MQISRRVMKAGIPNKGKDLSILGPVWDRKIHENGRQYRDGDGERERERDPKTDLMKSE